MPSAPFRLAWLAALSLGAITACTAAPPPPAATKIATLDPVNFGRSYVDTVALAPDASLVATGERGGDIRIWPTAGDPTPVHFPSLKEAIAHLAFSPDGRLLASLGRSKEGALRLWRRPDTGAAWTE